MAPRYGMWDATTAYLYVDGLIEEMEDRKTR